MAGSALVGGLSAGAVVRVAFAPGAPEEAERIPVGARVRDVVEGPDGAVYLLTDRDDGAVLRMTPIPTAATR